MLMPSYTDETVTLWHGDCLDLLRAIPDASIDAVVTDPPYGLGFMGHQWDQPGQYAALRRNGSPAATSREASYDHTQSTLREGAMAAGRYDLSRPANARFGEWCEAWSRECLRVLRPGGHLVAFGGARTWHRLAAGIEDAGFEVRDSIAWLFGSGFPKSLNLTDETGERTGWGTALKPAFEPIVVARKPLAGTVATNVLAHGTGALNIEGCRVAATDAAAYAAKCASVVGLGSNRNGDAYGEWTGQRTDSTSPTGRWPANVILDESQAAELDQQSGTLTSGAWNGQRNRSKFEDQYGEFAGAAEAPRSGDSGGASRFFYVAKADQTERVRVAGVAHPTVKPLDLMRWLVRLVTPPGGTVLEPFAGSGTTVEACILEGFRCVAIEREADYLPLITQRIHRRRDPVAAVRGSGDDGGLFDLITGGAT